MISTRAWGVGTHTTSLPGWPTLGSNGWIDGVWAPAEAAINRAEAKASGPNDLVMNSGSREDGPRILAFPAADSVPHCPSEALSLIFWDSRASGSSSSRIRMPTPVPASAVRHRPAPAAVPTAATIQIDAAVVSP